MGPVEAAPEYRVIVDANNLTVEIENELSEYREGRPVETENELSEQAETALPGVPHSLSRPHWRGGQDPRPPSLLASPRALPRSPCISSDVGSATEQKGDVTRKCIFLPWESLDEEPRLSVSH